MSSLQCNVGTSLQNTQKCLQNLILKIAIFFTPADTVFIMKMLSYSFVYCLLAQMCHILGGGPGEPPEGGPGEGGRLYHPFLPGR